MGFKQIDFGKGVRLIMAELRMSNVLLASRCGLTARKIAEVRNKKDGLKMSTMTEVAKGLDVSLSELTAKGETDAPNTT